MKPLLNTGFTPYTARNFGLVTTISSAASDRQRPDDVSVVGKHSDHTGHRMSNAENRMVGMDFLALGQGGKAPP